MERIVLINPVSTKRTLKSLLRHSTFMRHCALVHNKYRFQHTHPPLLWCKLVLKCLKPNLSHLLSTQLCVMQNMTFWNPILKVHYLQNVDFREEKIFFIQKKQSHINFLTLVCEWNLFHANILSCGGTVHDYFWKDLYVPLVEKPVIAENQYLFKICFYSWKKENIFIFLCRKVARSIPH